MTFKANEDSLRDVRHLLRESGGVHALEGRFGEIALEEGFIGREALESCIAEQRRQLEEGETSRPLGQILLQRGFISAEQCHEVLRIQARKGAKDGGTPFGKYILIRMLARGGMGTVFLAKDRKLDRLVALKMVREEGLNPGLMARFYREGGIVAQLQHPNIIGIHEVGTVRDDAGRETYFIAMDYIDGPTLSEILEEGKTGQEELLRILEETARAVAHAHSAGVVHRDLKPANVLVERNGRVVLTDFGLARAESFKTQITRSQEVMGTPHYMAPEQVEGRTAEIDERTDVYALGVMLYQILAGHLPFRGETPARLYAQIVNEEAKPPSTVRSAIQRDLEVICFKAMGKSRVHRYADALEFAKDLARFRKGEAIQARPLSWIYRMRKRLAKRKALLATGAGAVVVGAVVIAFVVNHFTQLRKAEKARTEEERRQFDRKEAEAKRYRWLQEKKIKPLLGRIQAMWSSFYVKDLDLRAELKTVETDLEDLGKIAKDPDYAAYTDVWITLGIGWYFVGDEIRAERALLRAEKLGSRDAQMNYSLGRIYLERSMAIRWTQDQDGLRKSRALSKKALRYLRKDARIGMRGEALDRHVAMAYLAYNEGDKKEVERICNEGLARFGKVPGTEEYWCLLGYIRRGSAGIEACGNAIKRRPHYAWAYFRRGLLRYQEGDFKGAIADYTQAIRINSKMSYAYNSLGNARKRSGDLKGAIAEYTEAIRLHPHFAVAYYNRGNARRVRREFDAAIADFTQAIRLDPKSAGAYFARGIVRREQGDVKGAISDFTEALSIKPDYGPVYYRRGVAREMRKDFMGAIADYTEAIRLDPKHARAYNNRGALRDRRRDFDGAIADYTEAIRINPKFAFAYYNRGRTRKTKGDLPGAISDYTKAIGINPKYALAYNNRGVAYRAAGDLKRAIADYTQALHINPQYVLAYYNRGNARRANGDLDGSISDYTRALKIAPAKWRLRERAKRALQAAIRKRDSQ